MNCIVNIHFPFYFEGLHSVNENGVAIYSYFNNPVTVEKIALNHYYSKSREEFYSKRERGRSDTASKYTEEWFDMYDRNEEFDDGILKYREERAKIYKQPDKSHANERLLTALMKNLLPTLKPDTPPEFYRGKMETFLTCRAVAEYLKTKLADDAPAKFFEEAALVAILKSFAGMTFADARLFLRELPNLLSLPYPVVKDLRTAALNIIRQLMNTMHLNAMWKDFVELDYLKDILKIGG